MVDPNDSPEDGLGQTVVKEATTLNDITSDEVLFSVGGLSDGYDESEGIFTVAEAIARVLGDPKLLGFCYKGKKGDGGTFRCLFKYYGAGPNTDPEWGRYCREDFFGDWSCIDLVNGMRGKEFRSYRLSIHQEGLVAIFNNPLEPQQQMIAWKGEGVPPIGKSVVGMLQEAPDADGPCWLPCTIHAKSANQLVLRSSDGTESNFRREYNPPLSRYRLNEVKRTIAHEALGETTREMTAEETEYPYNVMDSICYVMHPRSTVRIKVLRIVDNVWFDRFVLAIIMLNACALVLDDSLIGDIEWLRQLTTVSEIVFQIIFTIEMVLKIIALGFCMHPGSYLQTFPAPFWNRLDFVIVISGYIGLAAGSGNVPAVALLRCLRPLRTLNRVRELRQLTSTLSTALPLAIDIFLLFFLLMWVFSILGIQLFSGEFHRRCYIEPDTWTLDNATYYDPITDEALLFNMIPNMSKGYDLSPGVTSRRWLIYNDTDQCGGGRSCCDNEVTLPQECAIDESYFSKSVLTFDNIFTSLLLTFKLMSLDDWPDDMKVAQDAVGHHAWIYFFFCTLLGNVFAVNLILAVLSAVYSHERENRKIDTVKPIITKLDPATFMGAVAAHPILVVGVPFMVVEEQASPDYFFEEEEEAEDWGDVLNFPTTEGKPKDNDEGRVLRTASSTTHATPEVSPLSAPRPPGYVRNSPYGHANERRRRRRRITLRKSGEGSHEQPYGSRGSSSFTASSPSPLPSPRSVRSSGSPLPSPRSVRSSPASPALQVPYLHVAGLNGTLVGSGDGSGGNGASSDTPKMAASPFNESSQSLKSLGDTRMDRRMQDSRLLNVSSASFGKFAKRTLPTVPISDAISQGTASDSDSGDSGVSRRTCGSAASRSTMASNRRRSMSQRSAALLRSKESIRLDHSLKAEVLVRQASDLLSASGNTLHPSASNSTTLPSPKQGPVSALDIEPVSEHEVALQILRAEAGQGATSGDGPVNLPGTPEERMAQLVAERKRRLRRVGFYSPGTVGNLMFRVAKHKMFNLFIILVTVINICALAMDHYKISDTWLATINVINFVSVCIFLVEAVLKLVGMTPTIYFSDNYNIFDFILVLVSIPELVNPQPEEGWGGGGLSALRGFRLARVFRLAKKWHGLNRVLSQITAAFVDVGYLSIIVMIFLFCFSVMGVRQFHCTEEGERCYFENIGSSSLTVFIVLTGENWATMMQETLERNNWVAIAYFVCLFLFGNYILLNLLIAILIDSFQPADGEDEDLPTWGCSDCCIKAVKKNNDIADAEASGGAGSGGSHEPIHEDATDTSPNSEGNAELSAGMIRVVEGGTTPDDGDESSTQKHDVMIPIPELHVTAAPQDDTMDDGTLSDSRGGLTGREVTASGFNIVIDQPCGGGGGLDEHFRLEIESATTDVSDDRSARGGKGRHSIQSIPSNSSFRSDGTGASTNLFSASTQPLTPEEKKAEFKEVNGFLSDRRSMEKRESPAFMDSSSSMASFRKPMSPASPRRLSTWSAAGSLRSAVMTRKAKAIGGRSSLYPNCEIAASKGIAEIPQQDFHSLKFAKFSNQPNKYDDFLKEYDASPGVQGSCVPDRVQKLAYSIVSWEHFEKVVMAIIGINIVFISIDCPWIEDNRPSLYEVLRVGDYVFVSLFSIEMITKILAWGFLGFFLDKWNVMDAVVVITSVIGLFVTPLRSFRSLRVLRLVTAGSAEMKVVLQSVLAAMPAIQHVIFVSTMVWFIFAVVGVSLFKGALYQCTNPNITREVDCNGFFYREEEEAFGVSYQLSVARWQQTYFNFDDVFESMFSLFQISVGEGWRDMLYRTMDAPGPGKGPQFNSNWLAASLFYVAFIVLGQFFFLNLFIGVLIQSFAIVKAKCGGRSALMTESQKNWLQAQRVLLYSSITEGLYPEPAYVSRWWVLRWVHFIACSKLFEAGTTFLIVLNSIILAVQHYGQGSGVEQFLYISNWVFVILFTIEAVIKMTAFSVYYFSDGWNRFDFLIVLLSWVSVASSSPSTNGFRVLRVGRMLRLLGRADGLKTIVGTMMSALPSLMNIAVLLLVIFFIFGVFGVDLFGRIPTSEEINKFSNFENLYHALVTLYQVSTTETWPDIMRGTVKKGDCTSDNATAINALDGIVPNCDGVSEGVARAYFVLFLLLGSFIFLNLFIYVLIEHFEEEKRARDFRTKTRDLEAFDVLKREWVQEDPGCTGFVSAMQFIQLLQRLPEPLWLSSPFSMGAIMGVGRSSDFLCTQKQLRSMLIPLDKHMRVRYQDVIKTLSLKVFGINIRQAIESHFGGNRHFNPEYWNIHHYHAVQYVTMKWCIYRDSKKYSEYLDTQACPMRAGLRRVRQALLDFRASRKKHEQQRRDFVVARVQEGEEGDLFDITKPESITIILLGGVYNGELQKGRQHGRGTLVYSSNGGYYRGEWVDGLRHGHGVENRNNVMIHKGHWVKNVLSGPGFFANSDGGYVYEGMFVEGVPKGHGTLSYHNGVSVEGNFDGSYSPAGEATIQLPGGAMSGVFERHGGDTLSYIMEAGERNESGVPTGHIKCLMCNGDRCQVTTSDGSITGDGEMVVNSISPQEIWKGVFHHGTLVTGRKTIMGSSILQMGMYNELSGRILEGTIELHDARAKITGKYIMDIEGDLDVLLMPDEEHEAIVYRDKDLREEVASWRGPFEGWLLNGTGTAVSQGIVWTGTFQDGGLRGFSKILYPSGVECHGHFVESIANGWAKVTYPSLPQYSEEDPALYRRASRTPYVLPAGDTGIVGSVAPPLRYGQQGDRPPPCSEFQAEPNGEEGVLFGIRLPTFFVRPPANPLIGVFHGGMLWNGPSVDGNVPHGVGTAYLQSGLFFTGAAHAGKMHQGDVYYPDGRKLVGRIKFGMVMEHVDGTETRLL